MVSFVSIDLGASSGRVVVVEADFLQCKCQIHVVHRFSHERRLEQGYQCWNLDFIINEIYKGLEKSVPYKPVSIGIDTWGVDTILYGTDNEMLLPPISYRDRRTDGMISRFCDDTGISPEDILHKTAIQLMDFNTLYQLYHTMQSHPSIFSRVQRIAFLPDALTSLLGTSYFGYEYSNASTSQMINYKTKTWDKSLLDILGISGDLFGPQVSAGSLAGHINAYVADRTGLAPQTNLVCVASHDTSSAIIGTPLKKNSAFLSLGTWAMVGCESQDPLSNKDSRVFWSHEALTPNTFSPLSNIMGQWLITRFKEDIKDIRSFDEITTAIQSAPPFTAFFDVNHPLFINPPHMKEAIIEVLRQSGQPIPKTDNAFYRVIYENLALAYETRLRLLNAEREVDSLYVIGGGAQDKFSIPLIASLVNIPLIIGHPETTALGNMIVQACTLGYFSSFEEGRIWVQKSFPMETLKVQENEQLNQIKERYQIFLNV